MTYGTSLRVPGTLNGVKCSKMPKAMKKSSPEQSMPPSEEHESIGTQAEMSSSGQESDPEVSFSPTLPSHPTPMMFMPYIEGPKMNWTVDNGLYHRFLKWHLKCKTILDCKLANLPEEQKCQKVIAWLGDFSMDLWSLPNEELTLDTIWVRFEEFSKPQSNEVRTCFDLLTSVHQGNRNVDKWYNAVQAQVNLAKYPPETAKILHRDIFWCFMKDEDFVTKTINEGNVDIQKFPASKVQQLARKMESSKATANTSDRLQVTYPQHKYILCITNIPNFWPETTISIRSQQSKDHKTASWNRWQRSPLISGNQKSHLTNA